VNPGRRDVLKYFGVGVVVAPVLDASAPYAKIIEPPKVEIIQPPSIDRSIRGLSDFLSDPRVATITIHSHDESYAFRAFLTSLQVDGKYGEKIRCQIEFMVTTTP
jgi:hypothetical protein